MAPVLVQIAERRDPGYLESLAILTILIGKGAISADWQRLKSEAAAHLTGRDQGACSRALTRLHAQGYLDRRRDPFVGLMYRIKGER